MLPHRIFDLSAERCNIDRSLSQAERPCHGGKDDVGVLDPLCQTNIDLCSSPYGPGHLHRLMGCIRVDGRFCLALGA